MEKSKVDFFLASNSDKFEAAALMSMKDTLEKMDDEQFIILQGADYRSPTIIFIIAFFLGWERFFLNDIGMGVLKVLTCQGLGVWWLVDLFTAFSRTKRYNFNKFMETTAFLK